MSEQDFKNQVIQLLGQILEKQSEHDEKFEAIENKLQEHDKRFNSIDEKLNTIAEQVAVNTELTYTINQLSKQTHRNTFDINSIKDRLGN